MARNRRSNTRRIPPCRSMAMSSMLSAPATIPATSEVTFNPAFAPLSVGTVKMLIRQLRQTHPVGQRDHRDQPGRGHQIRFVEHRATHRPSVR